MLVGCFVDRFELLFLSNCHPQVSVLKHSHGEGFQHSRVGDVSHHDVPQEGPIIEGKIRILKIALLVRWKAVRPIYLGHRRSGTGPNDDEYEIC